MCRVEYGRVGFRFSVAIAILSNSRPDQHPRCCCGPLLHMRDGSPSCIKHFLDMPSSLPRWTRTRALIGYFHVLLRPSLNIGRVDVHNFTFEACSRFTRVTACLCAANLKVVLLSPELQPEGLIMINAHPKIHALLVLK